MVKIQRMSHCFGFFPNRKFMVEMAKNGGSHRVTTQSMGEVPGSRLFRATDADALNGMAQQVILCQMMDGSHLYNQ